VAEAEKREIRREDLRREDLRREELRRNHLNPVREFNIFNIYNEIG
jgi:hypothetical protein